MGRLNNRQQLKTAALDVLQAHGVNRGNFQDMTDAACVPKGSLYKHFANKKAFALEALKLYVNQSSADVLRGELLDPLVPIRRRFRAYWMHFKDRRYEGGRLLGPLNSIFSVTHEIARNELARYFHFWSVDLGPLIAEDQTSRVIEGSADA